MAFFGATRKPRGHNLLEMLLATIIFATALLPMAVVFQYIANSTAKTRAKLMGQYLAKGLIEKCLSAKFYNVDDLESVNLAPPGKGTDYSTPVEMKIRKDGQEIVYNYYQEVEVDNATGAWTGATLSAKVVRVRVSWDEKNRRDPATRPFVEYTSYIGQNS